MALAAASVSRIDFAQEAGASGPGKMAGTADPTSAKLRGVNLGSWLVLEKWMVPDIYRGVNAADEYSQIGRAHV